MRHEFDKNRNEARNAELRNRVCMRAYGREDGILKYANNQGYCSQDEIDAARYALGVDAKPGDVIIVGKDTFELLEVTDELITMKSSKLYDWRKPMGAPYTMRWSLKGEPTPRAPKPKPEPQVVEPQVVEPQVAPTEPTPSVAVPSVHDIQALLSQMAQDAVAVKQAELDDVSAKYAAQCTELQESMAVIAELNAQLKALREELEQAKAAGGIVTYKPKSKTEIKHAQFDELACYVQQGRNVLMLGKAGTGKTELAKAVARSLGLDYVTTGALVDKAEITGFVAPGTGKLIETVFYIAMKYGKLLILDEYDCSFPEAAKYANEITANRSFTFPNGEVVEAHPNFRIVACANTNGEGSTAAYNAAFKLDASTKDRFEMIEVDYMYEIDLIAAGGQVVDGKVVGGDKELVEFARELREMFNKDRYNNTYVMSPRRISGIYAGMPLGIEKAVRNGVLNHMNVDDAKRIIGNLKGRTKYHEAARKVVAKL